jgi:site-specific DNA-methyltransferase (adenine-specific)
MSGTQPYWSDDRATLYGGDALAALPDASVDAVITDPPYSSGGNRDQRAYGYWCALWLGECLRVTRPGGVCAVFTDWRQLPTTTDALQGGGWIWRGIVPWHKPNGRPVAGRFSNSCEYVVWGTAGPRANSGFGWTLPGFFQATAPTNREHMTQKPLSVVRDLVKIAPEGGAVLDPFMGAGTTGVAAVIEGRNFIGAELTGHYQRVARERIEASIIGYRDDGKQLALGCA